MNDPTDTEPTATEASAGLGAEAGTSQTGGGRLPTSTPSPGQTPPTRVPGSGKREIPWRLVGLGVLLVYGILFVILNSRTVAVSFVFFKPRVSLIVALVLALLIGFLAGYLFDNMRDRQRRDRSRR
jgi:uncharacterized integral membrane protein